MRSLNLVRRAFVTAAISLTALALPGTVRAQALPAAKELMEKNDAAIGGRAAFDKHSSFRQSGTMSAPAMGIEAQFELYKQKPSKYLQKIVLGPLGEVQNGFDGTTGWAITPGQPPIALDSATTESLKVQADFFGNFHDFTRYKSIENTGLVDFEGARCYKVKIIRTTGAEGYEFYDTTTGLIAGIQATTETPMGKVDNTSVFSDYKDFDGVKMPTKIRQKNAQFDAVISFTTIEWDKVDPAVFTPPESIKPKVKP